MKNSSLVLLALVLAFCLFMVSTTDVAYASTLGHPPCHHRPVPRPKPPVVVPIPKPKPVPAPCVTCNQKPIDITIERWCGGVHTKVSLII